MNRNDTLVELASVVRRHPAAALWALGFLSLHVEGEELDECLAGAQEVARAWTGPSGDHLRAYEERWGRRPQ